MFSRTECKHKTVYIGRAFVVLTYISCVVTPASTVKDSGKMECALFVFEYNLLVNKTFVGKKLTLQQNHFRFIHKIAKENHC